MARPQVKIGLQSCHQVWLFDHRVICNGRSCRAQAAGGFGAHCKGCSRPAGMQPGLESTGVGWQAAHLGPAGAADAGCQPATALCAGQVQVRCAQPGCSAITNFGSCLSMSGHTCQQLPKSAQACFGIDNHELAPATGLENPWPSNLEESEALLTFSCRRGNLPPRPHHIPPTAPYSHAQGLWGLPDCQQQSSGG